jgi:hypothetical protein
MVAAAQDEEHMLILACLTGLYAEAAIGRRGGSAPGRKKCKPRQRMEGYCILYADYFVDNPLLVLLNCMHQLLQDDVVEHIWRFRGNTN